MQKIRLLVEARINRDCYKLDWEAGFSVPRTNNIQFHGNNLSPILVVSRCKHVFSKTFGGAKRVFWQSMCMWSCNRWQITVNGAYHYFQVGFGCLARIISRWQLSLIQLKQWYHGYRIGWTFICNLLLCMHKKISFRKFFHM